VDYLKLTVWAHPEDVMGVLAYGVLDKYGWSSNPFQPQDDWREVAAGGRVASVYDAGCLQVVGYLDEVLGEQLFCSVEIKGQGCTHLGNAGVRLVLDDLGALFRIRASRVDVMVDTHAFTPQMVSDEVEAGNYSSRSVSSETKVTMYSAEGMTCYLGVASKPAGGSRRVGDRMLRFYDRRGPTRVELECHGEYAHGMGTTLREVGVEEWPKLIRGCVRHYCDFVDRRANDRVARCPLLPWWAEFVEDTEKISTRPATEHYEGSVLERIDWCLRQYRRALLAALDSYGPDWVVDRIKHHGNRDIPPDHGEMVAELNRFRGSGYFGAPERTDDLPF